MENKNELIFYVVPSDYDYVPSKLKLLLGKDYFKPWKHIHMTIIEPPCRKWPSVRNGNQLDDPTWVEDIFWPFVCITPNIRIFNKVSRFKSSQVLQQSSFILRSEFKKVIHDLVPYSNYLCILFENNFGEIEMVAHYQAGEDLYFLVKPDSLEQVKKVLNSSAKEITCWEYEHYRMK